MKLNGIDLNKLYILCCVVRNNGYKQASDELGLTRSAISQALTSLETQLGYNLFQRVGTKLVLTEPANSFYSNISRSLLEIEQSVFEFKNPKIDSSGSLRIGAYLEFTKSKMMPAIQKFLELEPNVQLKFSFHSPSKLLSALEKQQLDLCVSIFPYTGKKSSILNQKLYQEELVLISRKDQWPISPEKKHLLTAPIIDYYPNHVLFRRWWKCHYQQNLTKVNLRCYAASAEMVIEFVKRGLGIGVVPKYVYDHANSNNILHVIKPSQKRLIDYVWLIYFKQPRSPHLQNKFLNIIENMN